MKKYHRASFWGVGIILVLIGLRPITSFAWGDNYIDPDTEEKGRPSYTVEEINNGAIGSTPLSDGENYKNSDNYPGQIIFNTISDSTIGDEKNFVGARQTDLLEDGRAEGATPDTKWHGNNITVTDGAYYVIRLYVHNNNPNGYDAVAEDTRVKFSIPNGTSTEVQNDDGSVNQQIQVNGFISSSNATPSVYWDYVNFNGEIPFHLDYVYGSALLNNNKTQAEAAAGGYGDNAGWKLSDDIIKAESVDGVLIGSDALDGKVPGCYEYANYVTIIVRAVFDYEYTVEQKVRLAGSDGDWEDEIEADIGDIVEFRILYTNTSDKKQDNVAIKDILPSNLKYVKGSTILKNTSYSDGAHILNDSLVENGIRIGNYEEDGGNAMVYFKAEVVDEDLKIGANTLTNWSQAGVDQTTIQDYATVEVSKDEFFVVVSIIILLAMISCLIAIVILCVKIRYQRNSRIK